MMTFANETFPSIFKSPPILLTLVSTPQDRTNLRRLCASLQKNGGMFHNCPLWIFVSPEIDDFQVSWSGNVQYETIEVDPVIANYPFADKVTACMRAEWFCGKDKRCLVWFNPECLVFKPPVGFHLSTEFDAAFRPVHHQNIGSPAKADPDHFWRVVYQAVGLSETPYTVSSFVDSIELRPYFNTHAFSFRSGKNLMWEWLRCFQDLVADSTFQAGACGEVLHKIFLHQAVLSTLVARNFPRERVVILPENYNFPLNLHMKIRADQKQRAFSDLVTAVYEDEQDLEHLGSNAEFSRFINP